MTSNIKDSIYNICDSIFDYRLKNIASDLYTVLNEANNYLKDLPHVDTSKVNIIFRVLLESLEKQDYLLISDVLTFELLPMLEEKSS